MRTLTLLSPQWIPSPAALEDLERLRREQVSERPCLQLPVPETAAERTPPKREPSSSVIVIEI